MLTTSTGRRLAVCAATATARRGVKSKVPVASAPQTPVVVVGETVATVEAGGRKLKPSPSSTSRASSSSSSSKAPASASASKEKRKVAGAPGLGGATIRAVWDQDEEDVGAPPPSLKEPRTVSVVGAPMSWGQPHAGTDNGPEMIRQAGLAMALKRAGWRVGHSVDLKVEPPTADQAKENEKYYKETGALAHNAAAVGTFLQSLALETEKVARSGEFCLTIGGDHSVGCGTMAGLLKVRPDMGVIWVDAHADLNTPLTSETGNMHGMPVGILMSDNDVRTRIPGFGWLKNYPQLRPDKIVYIGLRDLDQAERREIKQKGITCFTMFEVDKYGIGQVMDRAFEKLGPSCPIHLSYDIDAVDPEFAPSTGTIVRGGFTYREAHYVAEAIASSNRLVSMDLVEINPNLTATTASSQTIQLGLTIVSSAMGHRIL